MSKAYNIATNLAAYQNTFDNPNVLNMNTVNVTTLNAGDSITANDISFDNIYFKTGGGSLKAHDGTDIVSSSGLFANTVSFESIPFGWERFSPGDRQLLFHAWTSVTNVNGSATLTEEEAPLNSFAIVYVHASGGGYSDGSGNLDIYNSHVRYYAYKAPVNHYGSPRTQGLFPILSASDRTITWSGRVHSTQASGLNEFYVYYRGYIKLGG